MDWASGKWLGVACLATVRVLAGVGIVCSPAWGQQVTLTWQQQVQKHAREQNWSAALEIVDREIAGSPRDMDIRAWRARIMMWSGRLVDAEREYLDILATAPNDPDHWMGLANVYSREGQTERAKQALDRALALDSKRADLHAARGRLLRAAHNLREARLEFQRALDLDPTSEEARTGLLSLRDAPKHNLRFGANTDLFSFVGPNHDEAVSLTSQWTSRWRTNGTAGFYRWAGLDAEKFVASVTGKSSRWGGLTVGGATARDNGVIPRDEAFFDYDQGWKVGQTGWVRGLETVYSQHWYWYSTARILTLNEMMILYLPQEWTWSLGLIGARSHFSAAETEWRPSAMTRVSFPVTGNHEHQLGGNFFFAAGTENFAQLDQIGHFSSQTYGGGLRLRLTESQDLTGVAAYQKRTQDRSETSFGFTYGLRF